MKMNEAHQPQTKDTPTPTTTKGEEEKNEQSKLKS